MYLQIRERRLKHLWKRHVRHSIIAETMKGKQKGRKNKKYHTRFTSERSRSEGENEEEEEEEQKDSGEDEEGDVHRGSEQPFDKAEGQGDGHNYDQPQKEAPGSNGSGSAQHGGEADAAAQGHIKVA